MQWSNISNGIEFRIYFNHGGHDSYMVEVVRCSLEEKDFEKHLKIFQHLVEGVERNFQKCTEDVAQFIATKTGISQQEIMPIIDKVIKSDIKWEEYMARASHIEIFRYEDGKVQNSHI